MSNCIRVSLLIALAVVLAPAQKSANAIKRSTNWNAWFWKSISTKVFKNQTTEGAPSFRALCGRVGFPGRQQYGIFEDYKLNRSSHHSHQV